MSRKRPFARIAITLPRDVLAAADRTAASLDRSRSWVIAQAVREYAPASAPLAGERGGRLQETATAPYDAAALVAEARRRHMVRDLKLTPGQRLRQAEELAELGRAAIGKRARRRQIIAFESYEDYYQWKTSHLAGA